MAARYDIHPSKELNALFAETPLPYQGQDPQLATVIFVGLDANYSAELFDNGDFRERILEYHRDGVAFWKRYGVHHPFLLPEYPLKRNTGGVPYHRKFSNMGLTPEFASKISFLELLNVPTTGSTEEKRFWVLFSLGHARKLDLLFQDGERRLVLLPDSVIKKMGIARKRFGVFEWLPKEVNWSHFHEFGGTEFHKIKHFSGSISKIELKAIGSLIKDYCISE